MEERPNSDVVHFTEDVYAWIEQDSSIHLKAVTRLGDPVELSADEARDIANVLLKLATQLESSSGG